tara:strand:- start:5414 stop:6187 length:774 start_codon:yes stop_codon:yes gene_type:complete
MAIANLSQPGTVESKPFNKMTADEKREAIYQAKQEKLLQKQAEAIGSLVRQITLFEGKKGRGKTLAAVAMAYQMREFFDIPTVVIGSSMDLTPAYGPHVFLDEREFIDNLDKMTKISKGTADQEVGDAIETVMENMGISIHDSLLVFDEAYKFFDARTPSDKLVRVFGYFVAQSRHYKSTIFLISPNRDMMDKRVRRQIDWFGRCFTNRRTNVTTVRLTGGVESWKLRVNGPTYWPMYDTHAILGFRAKHLNINTEA